MPSLFSPVVDFDVDLVLENFSLLLRSRRKILIHKRQPSRPFERKTQGEDGNKQEYDQLVSRNVF